MGSTTESVSLRVYEGRFLEDSHGATTRRRVGGGGLLGVGLALLGDMTDPKMSLNLYHVLL